MCATSDTDGAATEVPACEAVAHQSQWPTYRQFRELALQRQWSVTWLAQRCKANDPTATVERVLTRLTGARFDDKPLPYPGLCEVYWQAKGTAAQGQARPQQPRQPPPHHPLGAAVEVRHKPTDMPYRVWSTHLGWLGLWEEGWPVAKIAEAWHETPDSVRAVLDDLSMGPPPSRYRAAVPELPATEEQWKERRDVLRLLSRQGWSVDRLVQRFLYYSPEVMAAVVRQPLETVKGQQWAQKHLTGKKATPAGPTVPPGQRVCGCGCGGRVRGKETYASAACRMRVSRTRARP
jgi:hypothetical protein